MEEEERGCVGDDIGVRLERVDAFESEYEEGYTPIPISCELVRMYLSHDA